MALKYPLQCRNHMSCVKEEDKTFTLPDMKTVNFVGRTLSSLSQSMINFLLKLTERNMKKMYTFFNKGWIRDEKLKELTKRYSFYVIAYEDNKTPIGFAQYRFELNEEKTKSILYCYELQLQRRYRGVGLGRHMMGLLEQIAHGFLLKEITLTCQKANKRAERFYRKTLGYKTDTHDPGDPGYVILTKALPPAR
ncbi:N-alpha-acetyltransferase 40-like [Zophobas morio]|uniref:N-alpha-acetyltransferase 40-like n=1 Tax=Zophobas morio TaxID=2755281 RepID=UPI0030827243